MPTKPVYSQFTLNPYTGPNKKIAYRGKAEVIDPATGQIHAFRAFALGPYKSDAGNLYFRTVFYPLDAELAVLQKRMMAGDLPTPMPNNAPAGYDAERSRGGTGVLFPTAKDDRAKEERQNPDRVRTHFGSGVVLLDAVTSLAIDTTTWGRRADAQPGFAWHSGNADAHDPKAAAEARAAKMQPAGAPSDTPVDWIAADTDHNVGEPPAEVGKAARSNAKARVAHAATAKPSRDV